MENKVTLLGYYGGDKTHALSAWQSTNIELEMEMPKNISERIESLYEETVKGKKKSAGELLKMLADSKHYTPFEKSTLHFQVTADIASHIHCIKHRIATSINSESARYKELKDKWYVPEDWGVLVEVTPENEKLFQSVGILTEYRFTWYDVLWKSNELSHNLYHEAAKQLTKALGRKRAKETSRFFLQYSKQLDYDMMFNFRSFYNFYHLRASKHAQKEVAYLAEEMLRQIKEIPQNPFELTLKAFNLS